MFWCALDKHYNPITKWSLWTLEVKLREGLG